MKNYFRYSIVFLIVATVAFLQACQNEGGLLVNEDLTENPAAELKSQNVNTFYGPTVQIGHGVARAWVMVDKNGDPQSVGINFTAKALERLPEEPSSYVLYFPENKGWGFYDHALIDWNPHGHEPPGVYNLPHFDFHFYIISNEERLAIPPKAPSEFDTPPETKYWPPAYFETPGVVPEMGAHWIDLLSPENTPDPNDGIFTQTFIWGSYAGEFIFWEPMVTIAYLNWKPDAEFTVRQPSAFQIEGWYPMNYEIKYSMHPEQYTVALTNLVHHDAE